ncbi:pyrroloquinoline quinone biosynthesis protein PqqB [Paracoccus contaminans]|uniref:Coenzyme PQQ synthesis protein B n=1 Tax=Paracoccus contaminans TaxID=1945662 RepID=A0A1W6CWP2_9RHOB|nr:pyrroloquinoline quinone biosynthesis protein PqqB [Paracoccus contaminans]ARJ69292.1 pyrroloquinoline quinone biosynthesis protein PqqB [Paracoccus contaminans]
MKLTILGAAAGGGLPQWNCGCRNCADARAGRIPAMTQSSVAVTLDGQTALLNASPDIRAQLQACGLAPPGLRGSPFAAVVLTNGDVDHLAGLLSLREGSAFAVHATPATLDILDQPIFRVLAPDHVRRAPIALDRPFEPVPGLRITAFAVPGKVALYLEEGEPDTRLVGEQTVGLRLEAGGRCVLYIPGCAAIPDDLLARMGDADVILFDGTVWADDDMGRTGTGTKSGARMGHMAMSGPAGSIARLSGLGGRRVFLHVNNTNPVLQPAAPERAACQAAGWEIAFDGMEIAP